ncbi:imidazole glycerol phosphate synthase subunit HisH [Cryptosporangium phraense]|uniref:Imidazole glycerol phosphate synthase subunit HisH n=1 Tax=Cryptosporangium phraense TaxID=2593070 RepID=A0A545AKA1_9ACTN|nr:imidazole glycerol phosphate synthase subunit HisH [Cryptosporangium phraense]TQS41680.1 imidazole glycerol phosphate synthase subunit HisH [Cryptosporangium phraense]
MSPSVVVLDYGSGNLRSAERALVRAGASVTVTPDLSLAASADGLVVPGVGAYAACMAGIEKLGAAEVVHERVADSRPVLGICVGMQVLFEFGVEHGVRTHGLGVFPGGVTRLTAERIPHMGWNTVSAGAGSSLFRGVEDERFYFVHSYAAAATGIDGVLTTSEHDEPFLAAIERGAVAATQFHPEKSGDAGAAVLANWVRGLS